MNREELLSNIARWQARIGEASAKWGGATICGVSKTVDPETEEVYDNGITSLIRSNGARKAIQTISYAPYFLSNVVLVCIISVLFSSTGVVNSILASMGMKIQNFTSEAQYFRPLYIGSSIWQSMGFNAIIYIAALSSISPELYEAALIDGANKFQRVWYIDLPLIMPTVILMFILAVGNIMTIGYEKAWLMQAGGNTSASEIISTYVYKTGLQSAQYSFATAVGLFNSVVNFIILVIANLIAKKTADISIF